MQIRYTFCFVHIVPNMYPNWIKPTPIESAERDLSIGAKFIKFEDMYGQLGSEQNKIFINKIAVFGNS